MKKRNFFLVTKGIFITTLLSLALTASLFANGEAESGMTEKGHSNITVVDQTGREVEVGQPLERIVTIPIPAASMLIALDGGADRLVGMHPKSKTALEEGILKEFFPEALEVSSEVVGDGFMPNVETLIGVGPDLVFQWGHLGVDVVRPLENAGLNTVLLLYGTQEYLEGWISTFGTLLGKKEKAERILQWHDKNLREIKEKVVSIPEDEKPRVLYFLRWLSGKKVAAEGTYNDFYINLAGGKNPAGDMRRFPEVSEEQIIAWDPEIILLNGFESDLAPGHVYNNPKLADVSAVKNGKVYKVPLGGYRWDPPNQESPLMWKWLAMTFHPDRFSWDLREEIRTNYKWIYGKVPTDEQLDAILRMEMNVGSDGYSKFD
jgi:iron complex transport system substrate-binding protein